ncbi:MAG: Pycsar system effector family protein [Saprospiraceae bacterium]
MPSPKPEPDRKSNDVLTAYDESFVPWSVYMNLQNSIQFADNKINLLFVIAGIIFSIVIGEADTFKDQNIVYQVVFILFLIAMLPFMYFSIRTVAAHTKHKPDVATRKIYFFGDILTMQASQYIERFKSYPKYEHYDELLLQIHNLSFIAKSKFSNYTRALYVLCVMIVLVMLLLVLKVIGHG